MMSVVLGGPGQTAMGDIRETEPLTTSPHTTTHHIPRGQRSVTLLQSTSFLHQTGVSAG